MPYLIRVIKLGFAVLAFFAGVLVCLPVAGQKKEDRLLIPYRKGDLWGYADRNRRILITPAYEETTFFKSNLAKVKQDQKWGLIDKQGNLVTPFIYDQIGDFSEGLVNFTKDKQQGFLDSLGNEVILLPPDHNIQTKLTSLGYVAFRNNRAIIYYRNSTATTAQPGIPSHYYLIDRTGKKIETPLLYSMSPFSRGVAIVTMPDGKGKSRYTVIDKDGKDMLPTKYQFVDTAQIHGQVYYRITNLFPRYGEKSQNMTQKLGLVDNRFKKVVPVRFRSLEVSDNFVKVKDWFGKYGFWNVEKRKKLTRRIYDRSQTIRNPGRAVVYALGKSGIIDSTGKYIVPLKKQTIQVDFSYKNHYKDLEQLGLQNWYLFQITTDGETKAVDVFGRELKAFSYGALSKLSDSLFLITQHPDARKKDKAQWASDDRLRYGLLHANGSIIAEPVYLKHQRIFPANIIILESDTLYRYFTATGKKLADRRKTAQNSRRNLYRDPKQQQLPQPELVTPEDLNESNLNSCFYRHQELPNGYTIVANTCLYNTTSYGVIDPTGKVVLPFHYNTIFPVSNTNMAVRQANRYGVTDLNGKVVLPLKFASLVKIENGAFVTSEPGHPNDRYFTLRDSTGKVISEERFNRDWPKFKGDTAWASVGDDVVALNRNWEVISRKRPYSTSGFPKPYPGFHRQQGTHEWGFVDLNGNKVIPFRYTEVKPFQQGLAAVAVGKKWGYIDKTGKVVIPLQYQEPHIFTEGKAFVRTADGYQLISPGGKVIFKGDFQDVRPFKEGLAAVKKHNKWGFVNEQGKMQTPFKYEFVADFSEGMAGYKMVSGWGYLDKKGVQVIPPVYTEVLPFRDNAGWVTGAEGWQKLNRKGMVIESAGNRPVQPEQVKSITYFQGMKLFRRNPDGTETLLGNFRLALADSEGLVPVSKFQESWYYTDNKGNPFYETE